jgi:serine protease Do
MTDIEREPCPRCGEPAALSAQVCPHCRGNLLVDLVVEEPPADSRARYMAARALSSLGPSAPAFAAAQQSLALPGSILASGIPRDLARTLSGLVAEHGGRTRTVSPQVMQPSENNTRGFSWPWLAAAGFTLVMAGLFLFNRSNPDPVLDTRRLAERITPSTVQLQCQGSLGSGFFIDEDLVLTNAHVLCPAGQTIEAVFASGRKIPGSVEKRDDMLDIALVRFPEAGGRPLALGDATSLQQGDRIVFMGSPKGLDFTFHEGIVSHTIRSFFGIGYLQIDGNVNPGNSGGPLLDGKGQVVGIVSAKVTDADGMGLALPVNYLYEGNPSFLPALGQAPQSRAWRKALADIEEENRREVERFKRKGSRPVLVALSVASGQGVAQVLRLSDNLPRDETLSFTFRKQGTFLCRVSSRVTWYPYANVDDLVVSNSLYVLWLKRNKLGDRIYAAGAALGLQDCPIRDLPGSEMILDGGDEHADRILL